MLRKIMLVCVAIATIVAVSAPTGAFARGRGGGGRGFRGGWGRGGWGRGVGVYPYAYPAYGAYGCYRTVRVYTPWGPRWRRVWVCG